VTECFQTATFGGCGTRLEPFSSPAWPARIGALILAFLCSAFAAAAARSVVTGAARSDAILPVPAIVLSAVLSIASSPFLIAPVVLLIAALLWRRSPDGRTAATDLVLGLGLVVVGLAGTYLFYVAFALVMSSQLSTGFAPLWWYAAFVGAAGAAGGVVRASRKPSSRAFSSAVLWAYLSSAAGAVVTTALWIRAFYPTGRYVNPGMSGLALGLVLLVLPAMVAMAVTLRVRFGISIAAAVAASVVTAFVFAICSLTVVNVAGAFADATLFTPPLPLLPSTSTR
jgi:hypothetical protein